MSIQIIKKETRKATLLQIQGETMEAAKSALKAIRMAVELNSHAGRALAKEAFYRLNLCWYALSGSDDEKTRHEAGKLKREALYMIARGV